MNRLSADVFFVGDAQAHLDVRPFVQFVEQFLDTEIRRDEFPEFESRRQGLAADLDHPFQVTVVAIHIAHVERDAVTGKKSKCLAAPLASPPDIQNWVAFHAAKTSGN